MFTGMYYMDKLIKHCGRRSSYYCDRTRTHVLQVELYLDGETQPYLWVSDRHEKPTYAVPRAYRNHVNQQLLEDTHNG